MTGDSNASDCPEGSSPPIKSPNNTASRSSNMPACCKCMSILSIRYPRSLTSSRNKILWRALICQKVPILACIKHKLPPVIVEVMAEVCCAGVLRGSSE